MSWHQNEVRKAVDVSCVKFGHRIYIVKINRGAVIGRAVSPWSAYVRAYEFLKYAGWFEHLEDAVKWRNR